MTEDPVYRTSIVHSAAVAIRESFKAINVRWAIYGDLAWHLLCSSATGSSWRLDVHVMGDSSTIGFVTEHLASVDHRFSLASPIADSNATMAYIHDVQNSEPPMKKRQCQIRFVVGHLEKPFIVKDLPLLPIQLILHQQMDTYISRPEKEQQEFMAEVIAIGQAYLRLPNLPPPVWSLTFAERPLFLNCLAEITAAFPDAADVLTRLHPVLSPTATDISSLSDKKRRQLTRSEAILAVTSILSSCIRQLGHDCFLAGPGCVPWYIMGTPTIPWNSHIDFLISLHNDDSLGSLQHVLCQQGVITTAKKGAFQCSVLPSNGEPEPIVFTVTLKEVISPMGLRPGESTATDFNGISAINPSYLLNTMLASISSRGLPMEKSTYKNVVEALNLLYLRNADVRAAFEDTTELDQLVRAYVDAHPGLRPYFTAIGFRPALLAIPTTLLSEAVRTACDPTPTSPDILVSSSRGAQAIRRCLVNQDSHFSFQKCKTRGTYQVLQYQRDLDDGEEIVSKSTNVNIVMVSAMLLPFLSLGSTVMREGLPVVPLEALLLLKLQTWHDCMMAPEPYQQRKLATDARDIRLTLKVVLLSFTGTQGSWARVALSFFQEEFRRLTMDSVKFFCSVFTDCRDDWYQLGFEVITFNDLMLGSSAVDSGPAFKLQGGAAHVFLALAIIHNGDATLSLTYNLILQIFLLL
ncbi:hypothetical protein F5146DRAFT_1006897 [Armillaria mellea]|nr:hypothetical protein F5146DRAFT_1006897 [Armillaria mellea]